MAEASRESDRAQDQEVITAAMLVIGNEILSGRTQDANINYLAKTMTEIGVRLSEARVVPDQEAIVVEAVNDLRRRYAYLFTSGGIGPTHDDITVDCIAKAFGVAVIEHPEARRILEDFYGEQLTEARLRMARAPEGASLVINPVSGAPGIRIENVYIFAGVPRIFRGMVDGIAGELRTGAKLLSQTIVVQSPESVLAGLLLETQSNHPDVEIGSYPFQRPGGFGVSVVLRSIDANRLSQCRTTLVAALRQTGHVFEDSAPTEADHQRKA